MSGYFSSSRIIDDWMDDTQQENLYVDTASQFETMSIKTISETGSDVYQK